MANAHDEKQIATRYVTALFDLATGQKKLDAVAGELEKLGSLLNESADFLSLCHSPVLSSAAKMQAVMAIAKKAKMHALVAQLLTVLAANQRLALLPAIITEFAARMRAHHGEIMAEVSAAAPLDSKTEKSLVTALSAYTGKKVVLSVQQKPEILGGLKIRLGGVMIDASTAGKLTRLKEKLNQGIRQVA